MTKKKTIKAWAATVDGVFLAYDAHPFAIFDTKKSAKSYRFFDKHIKIVPCTITYTKQQA